ncbi:hypothetical protein STANM309S_05791 [Streptomyces tanashiensis]
MPWTRCRLGTSTGANRVDLCRSVALRGVLGANPAKIALARDALSPVFPYVAQGDGLYADGSFVQHTWVAYSGTYGQVMLDGLGRLSPSSPAPPGPSPTPGGRSSSTASKRPTRPSSTTA